MTRNTKVSFFKQMSQKFFKWRINLEIHDRIFPHHLGEKDHGYSFRTREEMNAQTQELNVQLLLDAIERHIRNMPDAYGESFRHIMHRDLHERLEWVLWQALWQWAKRRHRGKSLHWIASRYWHRQGRRAWQFAADTGERTPAGKPVWLRLVNPTETKIRRHVKVRADANPFDPHWHDYFEDRAFFRKFGIHRQEAGLKPSSEPAPQ